MKYYSVYTVGGKHFAVKGMSAENAIGILLFRGLVIASEDIKTISLVIDDSVFVLAE